MEGMSSFNNGASRAYYSAEVSAFLKADPHAIVGALASNSEFDVTGEQTAAWQAQIKVLQLELAGHEQGRVFFEFVVPRLGRRIDVVVLIGPVLFVMEFKAGQQDFTRDAREQVWDYALDLKNFHQSSHEARIVPLLVALGAKVNTYAPRLQPYKDGVFYPEEVASGDIGQLIRQVLECTEGAALSQDWASGSYKPTPTIIEAAKSLYARHSIRELARSDAGAKNPAKTSTFISEVIREARDRKRKAICLVTGVPGAGKTLVGLDVATRHMDAKSELHSVYLSGNGPLVAILREALTRDRVLREHKAGRRIRKGEAREQVETFIQNVHRFRDECLKDSSPPTEHVAIFDEAQRAWNLTQTANFMARKKNHANFSMSEPEFLISCLNRHPDWAVVVCLVGGGQEINTGEAGIGEWVAALERSYPQWKVYVSTRLQEDEYAAKEALEALQRRSGTTFSEELHLAVSMRSFRAENLSDFVKRVLDLDMAGAQAARIHLDARYPIRLTRKIEKAKEWLRDHARGSERYGIVVSSQAQRLKPLAIDVRVSTDPVHWFLDDRDDVRSSYYLEDVATEFDVQGLELDWSCVVWDADFRYDDGHWKHHSFVGSRWQRIRGEERQAYQKNAYRVLLTRARQGMVIVVPEGSADDPTRSHSYYDGTYEYLKSLGLSEL
jgi:hypothetical protein